MCVIVVTSPGDRCGYFAAMAAFSAAAVLA
jgi:hypothetical protein